MTPPHKDPSFVGPLIVGGLVIGGAFLFLRDGASHAAPSSATSGSGSRTSPYSSPFEQAIETLQAGLDTAAINSRTTIAQSAYNYGATANQDAAAVKVAQINGAHSDFLATMQERIAEIGKQIADTVTSGQVTISGQQTTAAQAISKELAQAQIQQAAYASTAQQVAAQQQAQAAEAGSQAQQNISFFGMLGGVFQGIFSMFGF